MNLLEFLIFQLEEHDLKHLLLTLVAGSALTMLKVLQRRNNDLLADSLEDRLAL